MYLYAYESIPLHLMDIFRRNLDFSPTSLSKDKEDISRDEQLEMFNEHAVKINTRGRPVTKSKKPKKPHPPQTQQPSIQRSYSNSNSILSYDFMGLSEEPSRHSSYTTPQTSFYYHPLLLEIPK